MFNSDLNCMAVQDPILVSSARGNQKIAGAMQSGNFTQYQRETENTEFCSLALIMITRNLIYFEHKSWLSNPKKKNEYINKSIFPGKSGKKTENFIIKVQKGTSKCHASHVV